MTHYLETLSRFVSETSYTDLSHTTLNAIKDVILDTIGAIVAGSQLPENQSLARLINQRSGTYTSTILGHSLQAEPMMSTLVNATAGVALEMDEGNRFGGGHPAIHSVPGALAVSEELGVSGKRFIESVLVGYELESRIGGSTDVKENVHSHGHWGTIGTAVAVAKLKQYRPEQIRSIINLAGSMSPANTWTTAFEGATIRNLYPGRSGFQGILAVHLYECGFTGLYDSPSDVFGSILGHSFNQEASVEGLGTEYRIEQNYFKLHACCRINHASMDAILDARADKTFPIDDIDKIDCKVQRMLDGMLGSYPENMLAAKFNVPYAVAVALIKNKTDTTAFLPEVIAEPKIKALASKVHVAIDPDLVAAGDHGPLANASIHLRDGRVFRGTTGILRGDYGNRIPRSEILAKFRFLTKDSLGQAGSDLIISTIDRLEELDDIRELTALL